MATDNEPMSAERLAAIRDTLADERLTDIGVLLAYVAGTPTDARYYVQMAQAAVDLLAEVERLQSELDYKEELLAKTVDEIVYLSPNITLHE